MNGGKKIMQCLLDQIQTQKPILAVTTDQMPGHSNRE